MEIGQSVDRSHLCIYIKRLGRVYINPTYTFEMDKSLLTFEFQNKNEMKNFTGRKNKKKNPRI